MVQSCNVTFNCYYRSSTISDEFTAMTEPQSWDDRVFYSSKDIVHWGGINQVVRKKVEREKRFEEKIQSAHNL